jgi:alpha-tubulin suppressor-like RCC1 family protein
VSGTFRRVDAGANHTCAIAADGTLLCWGRNQEGQLGVGDQSDRLSPTQVGTDTDWSFVSGGDTHSCAIRGAEGALYCWGTNLNGEVGDPMAPAITTEPTFVSDGWAAVSAGSNYTCAIDRAGALFCWGLGSGGQLGLGDTTSRDTPTRVCVP